MHAQAGAIGDHGIVAPRHAGTLVQTDHNQVNNDIDVGKWQMDQKIVDQKRPSQVKGSYVEGLVLIYATKHKNDLAMKEKILKNFKNHNFRNSVRFF